MPGLGQVISYNQESLFLSSDKTHSYTYATEEPYSVFEEFEDSEYIVTDYLHEEFVSRVPKSSKIRKIFWAFEGPLLRVWTILEGKDPVLQNEIYQAESEFMDKFREIECDFIILFHENKELEEIHPYQAHQVFPLHSSQ